MYSIVVPVYNRPDEVDELLESLSRQAFLDFEVIIVEDGSAVKCKSVCDKYTDKLNLHYYEKPNSGPGQSRNYGVERASGEYVIILDSDVVLPDGYLKAVDDELKANPCDAFGGADASHPSFTPVQKAISYSMTSFFTTGGIRGGKASPNPSKGGKASPNPSQGGETSQKKGKALDKFYPRSYNMGIRTEVYRKLGGFSKMRFGEDIDFSYRIVEAGYKSCLFTTAWVWHKRRTDLRKFFRQVYNSGIARINLEKRHPGTMKLVHLLPMVFTVGVLFLMLTFVCGLAMFTLSPIMHDAGMCGEVGMSQAVGCILCILSLTPIALYSLLLLIDSTIINKNLKVGILSIPAAFVQLMGYGFGFIEAWWKRCVMKKDEFQAFEKTFYK